MHLSSAQIGVGFWLLACLSALAWGGGPERWIATMLLVDVAAVYLLPGLSPGDAIHWWTLLGDVAVLAGMIAVLARQRRAWLFAAVGFQVVAVLAHLPRILDPGIHRWAYVATTTVAGYFVILALMVGTAFNALHQRSDRW